MRFLYLSVAVLFLFMSGCSPEKKTYSGNIGNKYILIYSSAALSEAVGELASQYEKDSGCIVDILSGGSAHQVRAIRINKKGDIIFSSIGEYVDELSHEGIVTRSYDIGVNRLVYFVGYGNPLNIDGSMKWLADKNVRSVIGSYLTSGAGEETHRTLAKAGILEEVFENAVYLASDSRQLLKSVADNRADLAVDWKSLKYSPASKGTQTVNINSPYFRDVKVKAGLLSFSSEKNCAEGFMRLALSGKGRQVFVKYGIENMPQ